MGFFSYLKNVASGNIAHANSILTPVINENFARILELDEPGRGLFMAFSTVGGLNIDYLIKPSEGIFSDKVTQFTQIQIQNLFELFVTWPIYDLINQKVLKEGDLLPIITAAFNISVSDAKKLLKRVSHSSKGEGLTNKLWKQVCDTLKVNPDDTEKALQFSSYYSGSVRAAIQTYMQLAS